MNRNNSAKLLIFFVTFCFLSSCHNAGSTSADVTHKDSQLAKTADSTSLTEGDKLSTIDSVAYKTLQDKFYYTTEKDGQTNFYYHKHWGKTRPDFTTIYAYFHDRMLFLVSNYVGKDSILHHAVSLLINGKVYPSKTIQNYNADSSAIKHDVVNENVTYPEERDFVKAIADNVNQKIKVKFIGRHSKEIVLSQDDKNAFKDVWDLYSLRSNGF